MCKKNDLFEANFLISLSLPFIRHKTCMTAQSFDALFEAYKSVSGYQKLVFI